MQARHGIVIHLETVDDTRKQFDFLLRSTSFEIFLGVCVSISYEVRSDIWGTQRNLPLLVDTKRRALPSNT